MTNSELSTLQTLKMSGSRYDLVLLGKKKGTSRSGYRVITPGRLIIVRTENPKNSCIVDVTKVTFTTFEMLDERVAMLEGYSSVDELKSTLKEIYPDLTDSSPMTLVEWK